MDIEDIVIKVQLSAEGVKDGVNNAVNQLKRLEDVKNKLSQELQFKISAIGGREAIDSLKALNELGKVSAEEEVAGYKYILQAYSLNAKEKLEIDKRLYALRKEMAKKELEDIETMGTGRAKTTDYAAQINELSSLKEKYAKDMEIADSISEEIAKKELERNKKINDSRMESIKGQIEAIDRQIELSRKKDGLIVHGVENEHSIEKEILYNNEKLKIIEDNIEFFKDKGKERTDVENVVLDNLLKLSKDYYKEIENLEIDVQRKRKDDKIKLYEENSKEALSLAKKYFDEKQQLELKNLDKEAENFKKTQQYKKREIETQHKEEIKALLASKQVVDYEYDSKIKTLKDNVDKEVAQYKRRIWEIDALLKQKDIGKKDEREQKNISIIKEQIKYEKDDTNVYELNKSLAEAISEFEIRKKRETLEAEKANIQEQLNEAKSRNSEEVKLLEEQKSFAKKAFEYETATRKANLEAKLYEAIEVLNMETEEGLKHYGKREDHITDFYKSKYEKAVKNANDEKLLMGKTQEDMYVYLISDQVQGNYKKAGEAHGKAYKDVFDVYLEDIAKKLSSLANRATEQGAASSSGLASSISGFLESAAAQMSFNAVNANRSFSNVTNDNRTGIVNQTFNVLSGEVTPYEAKKAAKASLKTALG